MRRVVKHDPIAKLSNFTHCQQDKSQRLLRKDISDFAALFYAVVTNDSEQSVRATADPASLSHLADLDSSCPAGASLIRDAWDGSVSIIELVQRLHLCELDLIDVEKMPLSEGEMKFRL